LGYRARAHIRIDGAPDLVKRCTVEIAGGWIEACTIGSGPPVLLLPGLGGRATFWRHVWPALEDRHQVISLDHRGCGGSSRNDAEYSIEQMSRDVLAILDRFEVNCTDVVGHSTGGAIALWLAVHRPERCRKLVLSSTWGGTNPYIKASFELRRKVLSALGQNAYEQLVDLMLYPPDWYAHHESELLAHRVGVDVDVQILDSRLKAVIDFNLRTRLGEITHPCLVVCPQDDAVIPSFLSREIASAIRGAHLRILPFGGHAAPRIMSEAFLAAVLPFLGLQE